jgi:hypothetical protein
VIAVHEEAIDAKPFPRALLIAGAALIGLSIAFAISARLWDFGATRVEYAPVTEQRERSASSMPALSNRSRK